ncbi:MAG: precorrin-6A/cobalt-precorrin-6A reductase [Crocinitomicaceae bacterium]|nr:precorrin-6A/cobalt-precorrin-6A reductase [Flavobacteriales bacterium]NQZ36809.1 precorrin-6A/cobalt-precorrin-6A reductase [Crocinitomicaceae bacterium]
MILVFGGTTEGKQVISLLNEMQLTYVYSTKTEVNVELGEFGQYRNGALTPETLIQLIQEEKIQRIIHAAHPFAMELHQTIDIAAEQEKIEVLRLERNFSERVDHELVKYLKNYTELLATLRRDFQGKKLLALTGVQSIGKLKPFWKDNISYFRILDRNSSIDIADKSDFPREQLILEEPKNLIGGEEKLIDQLKIEVIATKESGSTGALEEKIELALKRKVPIFILTKPPLPKSFIQVQNVESLNVILNGNASFNLNNSSFNTIER